MVLTRDSYGCRLDAHEANLDQHDTSAWTSDDHGEPRAKTAAQVVPSVGKSKNTSVYVTGLTTYMACKQLGTRSFTSIVVLLIILHSVRLWWHSCW
jgi:hypothetical protein